MYIDSKFIQDLERKYITENSHHDMSRHFISYKSTEELLDLIEEDFSGLSKVHSYLIEDGDILQDDVEKFFKKQGVNIKKLTKYHIMKSHIIIEIGKY